MTETAFVVDLARCTGCQACRVACRDRAGRDAGHDWLRIEQHEGGSFPHPTLTYRVVHCYHCESPACAAACPTAAIGFGTDGWVEIDPDLCIACGDCVEACPFGAVALDATATKCDGCADELARRWAPVCVRACPMRALDTAPRDAPLPPGRMLDTTFDDHGIGPGVVYLRRSAPATAPGDV